MVKKEKYPVLPLRDIVVYPKMIVPLFVGREKSIRALQEVVDTNQNIVLVTQKDASIEDPKTDDIFHVGTLGTVLQLLRLPDGTVKVLIEGLERVKLDKIYNNDVRAKYSSKAHRRSWQPIRWCVRSISVAVLCSAARNSTNNHLRQKPHHTQ